MGENISDRVGLRIRDIVNNGGHELSKQFANKL